MNGPVGPAFLSVGKRREFFAEELSRGKVEGGNATVGNAQGERLRPISSVAPPYFHASHFSGMEEDLPSPA